VIRQVDLAVGKLRLMPDPTRRGIDSRDAGVSEINYFSPAKNTRIAREVREIF
jgi:hypothetical protein